MLGYTGEGRSKSGDLETEEERNNVLVHHNGGGVVGHLEELFAKGTLTPAVSALVEGRR